MLKKSLAAIGTTAREFFGNWGVMGVLNLIYLALLASVYLFVTSKESSSWQLILTAVAAVTAPVLFFWLQAAGALKFAGGEVRPIGLLLRSLQAFWKFLLISLPLIGLAVLIIYLLNKLQAHFPVHAETPRPSLVPLHGLAQKPPIPFSWAGVALASLRIVLLGVILPLAAAHLWIAVARNGILNTLKRGLSVIGRALMPQSLMIYAIGLVIFGFMPYFLIFTRTPLKNGWVEVTIFGLRLALTFAFTLWGWMITLGALARATGDTRVDDAVQASS